MPLKLIKNTIFLTFATYTAMIANGILTIALARYLGANGLGVYTTVFTFVFFGTLVSSFGLPQIIVRNVAKNNLLAGTYFVNGLFIMVIFSFLCWMLINGVVFLMNYPVWVKVLILIGGFSILTGAVSDTCSSIFRAFEKMETPSLVASGMSILSSAIGVAMLWKGLGLFPVVSLIVVTSALNAVLLLIFVRRYLKRFIKNIDFKLCLGVLKQSFPVAIIRTSNILTQRVDILMLSGMQGLTPVGFYAAPVKIINFVSVPLQSLVGALLPHMSSQFATSMDKLEKTYEKMLKFFILFSLPITVIVLFFAGDIIHLLFGKEYVLGGSATALRILVVAFFFIMASGPAGATIFSSEERLLRLAPFIVAITALNIGLNILWIPKYSFLGASFSTLICAIISSIVEVVLVSRLFQKRYTLIAQSWKPVLAAIFMIGPLYLLRDSSWVLAGVTGFGVYLLALSILGEFKDLGYLRLKSFQLKR
jgi:O-antigen/teichoic acid export membrane protein